MEKKRQVGEDEPWLPSEGDSLGAAKACFAFPTAIPFLFASSPHSPIDSMTETETSDDDEDYLAGLTQRMAHSFLHDEDDDSETSDEGKRSAFNKTETETMAVSPQSTLCSHLSASKNSPRAFDSLSVSSLPSLPLKEQLPAKKPTPATAAPPAEPQVAWTGKNKSKIRDAVNYHALGVPSSAWPPLQKQQQPQQQQQQQQQQQVAPQQKQQHQQQQPMLSPGTGMRALFLGSHATKKESSGTGVFLPRVVGSNFEPRKKPACSTVLVPARVVQALNLNLEELGAQPTFTNGGGYAGYVLNHDALLSRTGASSYRKRSVDIRPQPVAMASPDVHLLPHEWTY